jgi:hypothetical protein
MGSRWGLTSRPTDWLTVSRNVTFTLTWVSLDGSRRWLRRNDNWEWAEFRDASLPGYELRSRRIELRDQNYWVQFNGVESLAMKRRLYVAIVPGYFECVIQWDCYSFCVNFRCQETASRICNRLRTLVFAVVNCSAVIACSFECCV